MVSLADATTLACSLPEVTIGGRYGNKTWLIGDRGFAWERPFSKADLKRFGSAPVPSGTILAVRVADLRAKEAILAEKLRGVFTIQHFDNYPAVLIQLELVAKPTLRRLLTDAWLASAPPSVTSSYRVRAKKPRG